MATTRIKTPHATVLLWNYIDRIAGTGADLKHVNEVDQAKGQIITAQSILGIQTYKTKGDPVGRFHIVLAPTRNWISTITLGSWCVVMMSNQPFDESSIRKADPNKVKMIGRITSVRCEVTNEDGVRQTRFNVSGEDWGQTFNNTLYIDPLIADRDTASQGNLLYVELIRMLKDGALGPVRKNLLTLLSILGMDTNLQNAPRLGKAMYSPIMPKEMVDFFGFVGPSGKKSNDTRILNTVTLETGILRSNGTYEMANDGLGWIDPYSLVGAHNLWQVLMDNSNYALNELYNEIQWSAEGPQLKLYNRIKPFSYREQRPPKAHYNLRSKFQFIPTHYIDNGLVISVNAGTAWHDKVNFVEIKPEMSDFRVIDIWTKQKSQGYDRRSTKAFDREGFRPLFFAIKQMPWNQNTEKNLNKAGEGLDLAALEGWVALAEEWFFDVHRMINGELVMTGSDEYLAVGNNIMLDLDLLGITPNINGATKNASKNFKLLAHIESVQHNFSIDSEGARQFRTTVHFCRGIIVDKDKNLVGEGVLDSLSANVPTDNSINVVKTRNDE